MGTNLRFNAELRNNVMLERGKSLKLFIYIVLTVKDDY